MSNQALLLRFYNHPPIQAAGLFHEGEPMGSPSIARYMSMYREEKLFNRASIHLRNQQSYPVVWGRSVYYNL
jgi:hypothetical protein